ncbi:MAG: Na-K-Cl cotransporter [Candidatus Omnitrophica bacterium]|nr:Na-K-Cl cotransporter [Candidatus Omnitrophota bacterium]MCB9720523.1 Na-K-Cl cotransporter [Candidatus Omnitrophota bacterium]
MSVRRFSTFEGVFTPCLLSILGVIMYLRLGWVVGQVGLSASIIIIVLANLITLATALCMSSMVTNIRIGPGGAYSIITKSLGIEAGGAIGIPLYMSQAISVAFYITGFTEAWHYLFPEHSGLAVSLIVWGAVLGVTYFSTKLAFRIQYGIMAVIFASLATIFFNNSGYTYSDIPVTGERVGFWPAFAVFFPAVTGIMAGASMSGELKEPAQAIPRGTLAAILVSFLVYVALAVCFAARVPAIMLRSDPYVAIGMGAWPKLVLAGIMGATLSSAMSTAVGAPRVLVALSRHRMLPFSEMLEKIRPGGEPTRAILVTFAIALLTILLGSLNQIAGLLTMFFLITYGMINLTVFIEQSIGIVSFRPSFRIPRAVSLLGSIGCLLVMLVLDARFSVLAMATIGVIYYVLIKRHSQVYSPDVRSGALVYLAEKFAQAASKLPYYPKIWKPNILMVLYHQEQFERALPLVRSIVYPEGRLSIINVIDEEDNKEVSRQGIREELAPLRQEGIFTEAAIVQTGSPKQASFAALQTVRGFFFPPNTFLQILDEPSTNDVYTYAVVEKASHEGMGIILLGINRKLGFQQKSMINLWVRRESPNINLAVLVTLQLEQNWEASVRLIQVVADPEEAEGARTYLEKIKKLMRLSSDVMVEVLVGDFQTVIQECPVADLNIFGMQAQLNLESVQDIHRNIQSSVLFIKDSANESALA